MRIGPLLAVEGLTSDQLRAGIPVTDYGFTTSADEAREIAARIGGPTVIKSQVLSGGRMKAGGVQFADTPDEARAHAETVLQLEISGHMPRGILVDPKADIDQEFYVGVVWDGTRKQPVIIFSPVGGIDIEQVAEEHADPRLDMVLQLFCAMLKFNDDCQYHLSDLVSDLHDGKFEPHLETQETDLYLNPRRVR